MPVDVSFGDAIQVFNIGAASCGAYGAPAGVHAAQRALRHDPAGRAGRARRGARARRAWRSTPQQAYLFEILAPITEHTAESRALFMPDGRPRALGEVHRDPELADALERLGAEGPAPFYTGDVGGGGRRTGCSSAAARSTREDLAAYEAIPREPVRVAYRGREVLTNPPPSAGGTLLAYALALLEREHGGGAPSAVELARAMERAQSERTPALPRRARRARASWSRSWPAGSARPRTSR